MYIHELPGWPKFHWDRERLAETLAAVRHRQGRLTGQMEALGFDLRQEAVLETLTADVLKTSEIEGEKLEAEQVRSSIARRLGMDIGALRPADRNVEGVVEMMLDATRNYDQPLTTERLFAWHASLFPTGRSGMHRIRVGAWRDDSTGPMEVVSGADRQRTRPFPGAARETAGPGDARIPGVVQPGCRRRAGSESGAGPSLVRHDPSFRRWQRPHRARDCRHDTGTFGGQSATLLQHVGADPAGARCVLPRFSNRRRRGR